MLKRWVAQKVTDYAAGWLAVLPTGHLSGWLTDSFTLTKAKVRNVGL